MRFKIKSLMMQAEQPANKWA